MGKKVIGIGIIGAGFARTTQIPGFKDCIGARVMAIASAHRENAERVADEFKIRNVANDWRELIARDDVDLKLAFRPPYDWPHVHRFLAARAIPGIERVDAASYSRTIASHDGHAIVRLHRARADS